jgi:hypothetical protein
MAKHIPNIPTSEVLHKAADHIERRGWEQGGGWNSSPNSAVCLEGGIAAALGVSGRDIVGDATFYMAEFVACPAYQAVQEYLALPPVGPHGELWRWNDRSVRTKEQVIEVLRAAAEVARVKETTAAKQGELIWI